MQEYTVPGYTVVDMSEDGFESLYPLVRTALPDVSLSQWFGYARPIKKRGGILALVGSNETLFGFLTYRLEMTLKHGPVLRLNNFVTFELSRAGAGRRALYDAAEELARKLKCAAVELRVSGRGYNDDAWASAQTWAGLGFQLESVVLSKRLIEDAKVDRRLVLASDG